MKNLGNYRVSLKFSEKDADQTEVVQLLKQMGRRKSQFITKAVKYYLANEPEAEIPMPQTQNLNKNALKEALMELLLEMNLNPESAKTIETKIINASPKITEVNTNVNDEKIPDATTIEIDEADLDDFLDGLDEFDEF
jgi:hypothetical protein